MTIESVVQDFAIRYALSVEAREELLMLLHNAFLSGKYTRMSAPGYGFDPACPGSDKTVEQVVKLNQDGLREVVKERVIGGEDDGKR
jgi:ribosomal protein L4